MARHSLNNLQLGVRNRQYFHISDYLRHHRYVRLLLYQHTNEYSAFGVVLIFVEIPFLLRICPTSAVFDGYVKRCNDNYPRAALYIVLAAVLWLSLIIRASSLIAAAILLTLTSLCYAFAGLKSQEFTQSKTLGGAGLVQMVV